MLRKRLVTVLTVNSGVLFRTRSFVPDYRYTLNFVDAWSVDEIVVLDITRNRMKNKEVFYATVKEFAQNCFVPLAVGGGVASEQDFSRFLGLGADKVVLNTFAVEKPELISSAARKFGSQCVVVSMDVRKNGADSWEVFTEFGTKSTGLHPCSWAKRVQELGAGEIMITSVERDGSLEGYDNNLNAMVADAVGIPVLGCGGAGKWQHLVDGVQVGRLSAVGTTNVYHFTPSSIVSAKRFMKEAGVNVRI